MRTTAAQIWFIGILGFFGFLLGGAPVFAVTNNISGYIWGGDNATLSFKNGANFLPMSGWTWGNNAGNTGGIGFVSLGDGATYGLSADDFGAISGITGVPGNEGYAWGSNYGWINFNAGCPSNNQGAKIGSNTYTGCNAQFVNPTTNVAGGNLSDKTELVGWARACAVFESGCSGTLLPDIQRGGWDGWISLSKYNDQDFTNGTINVSLVSNYHVSWNPTTTQLSGFAWGGSVVGWINFAGATMEVPNQPIAITLTSPNTCSVAGGQISLTWGVTGTGASTYHCTGTSTGVPQKWLGENAVPSQTKTVTVGAVPDTFIISCTSSNPTLADISASFTTPNNTCTGPVLKIEQNPAWTKTLPSGEQCVDPNDVYSPKVSIDMTSLGDTNAPAATTRCDVNWGKDIGTRLPSMCLNRNTAGNAYVVFANNVAHPALWLNDKNRTWSRCANQGGKCDLNGIPGSGSRNYVYGIPGTNNYVMQTLDQPTCDGTTFGTADIPGAQCFFDPSNSPTPTVKIIKINGHDQVSNPDVTQCFDVNKNAIACNDPRLSICENASSTVVDCMIDGTAFSENYPPTDVTIPSVMDISTYPNNQAFGDNIGGANGQGWNTVDFLYPKEAYFDVDRCTTYLTGYANKMWTILHPSDPINNNVPFKEGNNFVFKLNDNLPSFYGGTAHNDPTIGPHQQCIVFPQNKNSYSCHYAGTATCAAPVLDPLYAKPQPPYDQVTLSYCDMSTTLVARPNACQVYNTPLTIEWSVPSANATTCTATTTCTDPNGQDVPCSGWTGPKSATAGLHSETDKIIAPSGAQELYATLSLTCDNPTSGKTSTSTSSTVHIQPNAQACIAAAVCGNAVVEVGEQCDAGASNGIACVPGSTGCTYCGGGVNACKIVTVAAAVCGDGVVDATETCDDGNMKDDDECYSKGTPNQCTATVCGDGIEQNPNGNTTGGVKFESCDDGNSDDFDGCTTSCSPTIYPTLTADLTIPSCVVSGDGSLPSVSWTSSNALKCTGGGDPDVGFDANGGNLSDENIRIFPLLDNMISPILPGSYSISLDCTNAGAIPDEVIIKKDISVQASCPTGGGGGTSAPIQPVYIDS